MKQTEPHGKQVGVGENRYAITPVLNKYHTQ